MKNEDSRWATPFGNAANRRRWGSSPMQIHSSSDHGCVDGRRRERDRVSLRGFARRPESCGWQGMTVAAATCASTRGYPSRRPVARGHAILAGHALVQLLRARSGSTSTTPIPPLERVDLGLVLGLVREEKYFVLQRAAADGQDLASAGVARPAQRRRPEGAYRCVYVNVEAGQALREDLAQAMPALLDTLARQARTTLGDESLEALVPPCPRPSRARRRLGPRADALVGSRAGEALGAAHRRGRRAGGPTRSSRCCASSGRAIRTARSTFRQSRGAVRVCAMCATTASTRVRRRRSVTGGSAFNIKAESLRLGGPGRGRGAGAARSAHGRDRPGLHPGGARYGVGAEPGPAVAGECVGL